MVFCWLIDPIDDRQGLLLQSPAAYLLLNFDQSLGGSESQSKKKLQVDGCLEYLMAACVDFMYSDELILSL